MSVSSAPDAVRTSAGTAHAPQSGTFETGHIGINVTDLAASRAFYQTVFGFSVMTESADPARPFVFLGDGNKLVLTLWQQSEGRFSGRLPGLHHLSFQVGDIADVRAAEARLRTLGASVLHNGVVPHREGAQSGGVFFEDPDGTRLEIFAPEGVDENPAPYAAAPTCGFF